MLVIPLSYKAIFPYIVVINSCLPRMFGFFSAKYRWEPIHSNMLTNFTSWAASSSNWWIKWMKVDWTKIGKQFCGHVCMTSTLPVTLSNTYYLYFKVFFTLFLCQYWVKMIKNNPLVNISQLWLNWSYYQMTQLLVFH